MGDGGGERPLGGRLLDLFVAAPAGLVVAAGEEVPKLLECGRSHLESQLHTARAVGRFTVTHGSRRIRRLVASAPGRPAPPMPPQRGPTAAPPPAGAPRPAPGAHVPQVGSLAIPGYDSLSASQVVQRLDGLSRPELVAVRAYEWGNRARRTILNRVDQLLDERS